MRRRFIHHAATALIATAAVPAAAQQMAVSPPMVVVAQPPRMQNELGGGFIEFVFGDHAERSAYAAPPPQYEPPSSRAPAYVALGVGVAGIAVGSIFGLMATGKKGDLDDNCTSTKICPPEQQDNIDTGKTLGTISTIGFVAGGVGVGAGVVLLLVKPQSLVQQPADEGAKKTSFRWSPFVGVGSAGVEGTF